MTTPLVPAYIWPTDSAAWDRALAGPPGIVVVTGADSGPGPVRSQALADRIAQCVARRWQPIGYVPVGYLGRPIGAVARDVERWREWYPQTAGIFFDEYPSADVDAVPMLAAAAARVGPRLVLNAGTSVGEALWRATWPSRAIVVTYEGPAAAYDPASVQTHARAAHLVHHAPAAPRWPRGLGWAWSTPDGADGNPWDAT